MFLFHKLYHLSIRKTHLFKGGLGLPLLKPLESKNGRKEANRADKAFILNAQLPYYGPSTYLTITIVPTRSGIGTFLRWPKEASYLSKASFPGEKGLLL
jgi:hypothetical protein